LLLLYELHDFGLIVPQSTVGEGVACCLVILDATDVLAIEGPLFYKVNNSLILRCGVLFGREVIITKQTFGCIIQVVDFVSTSLHKYQRQRMRWDYHSNELQFRQGNLNLPLIFN